MGKGARAVQRIYYLEGRGEVVLEEPELDRRFGVLQNREHHYSGTHTERGREGGRDRQKDKVYELGNILNIYARLACAVFFCTN